MTREVTLVRAEPPLTDNVKAYAELLTTTIKQRCGAMPVNYFTSLTAKPEIGFEYKDTHQRNPNSYQIYMPVTTPQLGFKIGF